MPEVNIEWVSTDSKSLKKYPVLRLRSRQFKRGSGANFLVWRSRSRLFLKWLLLQLDLLGKRALLL